MRQFDLLIRGGEVVTPDAVRRLDIGVADGRIAALGAPGTLAGAERTVDAEGRVVLPGVIDVHLHCNIHSHHVDALPITMAAAARGGVTCGIVHLLPSASQRVSASDLLNEFRDLGAREGVIDFSFHAWLAERDGVLAEIPRLIAQGIPSFKLFLAYRSIGRMSSDGHLLSVMEAVAAAGGLLLVHAEDGEVIDRRIAVQRARGRVAPVDFRWTHPDEAEWLAIDKAVRYARLTGCPLYVVHVSTPRGVERIAAARDEGQAVWAETCPQYLELTDRELERWGPLAKISPPLRDGAAADGLWHLLSAERIQVIGSDHSPHSRETKAGGFRDIFECWYGAPGVQTMLPVMWDAFRRHRVPPTVLARLLAATPARIFGLAGKGVIAPGMDADLVLIDPEREAEIRSEDQVGGSGYTLYHGRRVRGWPVMSFLRGRVLLDGDALRLPGGSGRYIARPVGGDR
ncbi:MAG TPA: amidohydrolase family protein [bacterium]|nr:amidohydrolase family protein [bacterium]